jgi:four helix bundle protein
VKSKKFDLEDRLVEFAANVAMFCVDLPKDMTGAYYSNQLLRSGGSSALNFGEAQGTNSDRDYINKSSLSLKELKESRVNLKILKKLNYGDPPKCLKLLDEVEQLIKIIAAIIKNRKF